MVSLFCTVIRAGQGGEVVNHDFQMKADVLIEDGLVKEVAQNIKVAGCHLKMMFPRSSQ